MAIEGDLQIKDFVSKTPRNFKQKTSIAGLRTPGQILSLTSHLSFASKNSNELTDSLNSVSTMSDGNIAHHLSPQKLNTSMRGMLEMTKEIFVKIRRIYIKNCVSSTRV